MDTHSKQTAFFAALLILMLLLLPVPLFAAPNPTQANNQSNSSPTLMPTSPTARSSVIATGSVDISSYPANAIVWYETPEKKVRAGQTPFKLGLIPGNYLLTMVAKDYPEYSRMVAFTAGMEGSIFVDFTILPRPSVTPFPRPSPIPLTADYECEFAGMRDRVSCRISFFEKTLTGKIPYLPEECRNLGNSSRGKCVSNYAQLRVCSVASSAIARDDCQRRLLKIGNIDAEKLKCDRKKVEGERLACNDDLRVRVHLLVKSRLYDLEENAIRLMRLGASEDLTIDFLSSLEGKIAEFNSAGGLEQRKKVIWDVISLWGEYRRDAKAQLDDLALRKK